MHFDEIAQLAAVVIGVGSLGVSGILWNIIKAYKERIDQLEDETKSCQDSHIENLARIKQLEGIVEAFRDVPLRDIAKTQKEILKTQKDILSFIKEIKNV